MHNNYYYYVLVIFSIINFIGQFHNGEFHGYGLLVGEDGSQYEGGWSHNRREGN